MTGSAAPTLKRAANGFWYIHWVEGRRSKRTSAKTRTLSAAVEVYGRWLLEEGPHIFGGVVRQSLARQKQDLTCAGLWAAYRAQHVANHSASPESADWAWGNLKKHFGKLPLKELTQQAIDNYAIKRLAGKIGRPSVPATVRRELIALSAAIRWCAGPRKKLILMGDVPQFELPPAGQPRDRWLRHDEIRRLLEAATATRRGSRLSRGERFLWLALETAARKTAIQQLTWDRVDFETGVIHYDVPGRRKTRKRRSSVPMSEALRPIMTRACGERVDASRTDGPVLDNDSNVWAIVRRIAKRAGVKGVSPNVLRHTAATHMARRGVPLWKIAGVLGNSAEMVERVYAKHAPDGLLDAVNAISSQPTNSTSGTPL